MNVVPKSYRFADVLSIINGRNQKKVEAADGQYPIYGSGGIMGWANDYICPENTVVIGRKGSINNPIYVDRKFWNVDTAFGLVSNRNLLLPRYLFYFCVCFDFEKLNTTVTIPSLTKTNLLQIKISLPPLEEQEKIIHRLDKLCHLIELKKEQLKRLDILAKSRFIEMFGDPVTNPRNFVSIPLNQMANIASGITKGRKTKDLDLKEVPYMAVSNVKDGYIDWTTVKTILATHAEIQQYRILPDDVLMTEGGDPDKLGRGALIRTPLKDCIHQNHIFRVRLDKKMVLPVYFAEYLKKQKAKRYFLGCAKQTTGIASINMTQLRVLPVLLPPITLQNEFASFIEQLDKSKFSISRQQKMIDSCQRGIILHLTGRL